MELMIGRMRCLGHLGQWDELAELVSVAKGFPESSAHTREIARFELEAALNRGRWEVSVFFIYGLVFFYDFAYLLSRFAFYSLILTQR